MPRNGSGVYSKPAGTTAVPNTTIESAKYNSTIDDLVDDANAARPVVSGGTGATTAAGAVTALGAASLTTTNSFTKTQKWAKGADVASATALTLGSDGNYFDVTGTTAITSIDTVGAGTVVKLHFDDALVLTHHATDLVLPGGANITTAAGDEAEFVEYATGDWRCTNYQNARIPGTWEPIGGVNGYHSLSNVAQWAVTDLSAFRVLRITGFMLPASEPVSLSLRTSTNNGSSYDAGASDYRWERIYGFNDSAFSDGDDDDTRFHLSITNAVGADDGEGCWFSVVLHEFNQSVMCQIQATASAYTNTGLFSQGLTSGNRLSTTARDAFVILFSSGNIARGYAILEGVRS